MLFRSRNQLGLTDANSTEFNPNTPHPVIDIMGEQKEIKDKGATMRLGAWPCVLKKGSLAYNAYEKESISERHRHRYEFNNQYREQLEEAGMLISGTNPDRGLVEIIEVKNHPWFVAVQFHPEFQSKPNQAHPLFASFVEAALVQKLESCNQQTGSSK